MRFEQQLKFKYFMKFIWNNFRFWIQFSAQFTFPSKNSNNCFNMCSNNCFLLEQFLIVCLPPGAFCQGNSHSFETRGSPFFGPFFGALFLLKIVIVDEKRYQNGVKMRSYGAYFLEKMQKRKSVFRLHRRVRIACEPIPWSAQGDPKIKEKTWHISEPTFLIKNATIW